MISIMMKGILLLLFITIVIGVVHAAGPADYYVSPISTEQPVQNHHSLHVPFDQSQVYWMFGGSTVLTQRTIRLTPSTQDVRGWLWNDYPIESENFEIEFRVMASSKQHYGGEGMAMWILDRTEDPHVSGNAPKLQGPLFGLKENFKGVGIIFDVYDNDGGRDNPSVFVLDNRDGADKRWSHNQDFSSDMYTGTGNVDPNTPANVKLAEYNAKQGRQPGQPGAVKINYRCKINIRNVGAPVRILVKYLHNIMHVYSSDLPGQSSFHACITVDFPEKTSFVNHHIAFTAMTGQAADTHEISEIIVRYLDNTTLDPNDVYDATAQGYTPGSGKWHFITGCIAYIAASIGIGLTLYIRSQFLALVASNINAVLICQQLNPLVYIEALLYVVTVLLLLTARQWFVVILHLPLFGRRVYQLIQASSSSSTASSQSSLYFTAIKVQNENKRGGGNGGFLTYSRSLQLIAVFYGVMCIVYLWRGMW